MDVERNSIKILYEREKMSPLEIAIDRELDVAVVKAALASSSVIYRRDCGLEESLLEEGKEPVLGFSPEDERLALAVIRDAAADGNTTCAMYIRDDRRGRKDKLARTVGNEFNILQINNIIAKGRLAAEKMIRDASSSVVSV